MRLVSSSLRKPAKIEDEKFGRTPYYEGGAISGILFEQRPERAEIFFDKENERCLRISGRASSIRC